jgi:hypothetical protein
MNIFFHFVLTIFRGIVMGIKSIVLLYIMMILTWLGSSILLQFFPIIFRLLNGFLDALIISIKNITKYKIVFNVVSCIIGLITSIFVFLLSLYKNLPNILVDFFVYGEGGGGLEPGGWFGFNIYLLIYCAVSLLCFSITMSRFSNKKIKVQS